MDFITEWLIATWATILEAAPWLLGGFGVAGVIYVLMPTARVVTHLGTPGLHGVLKAALIGVPLPLCSCSVIPVATSLRKQGAGRGATASFLISTPETGVDSIAMTYALLGPLLAALRPIAAFVTAVAAGVLVDRQGEHGPEHPDTVPAESCCCSTPQPARTTIGRHMLTAGRYAAIDLFVDLSHWLAIGFLLAGLLTALIPEDFLERSIGSGFGTMLLMVVAGLPLYVCATASTPLAAALIAKGLSPGAALVFLLVGPATNMATMVIVARDLGRRSLAIYVAAIVTVALVFGVATDAVVASFPRLDSVAHCSCAGHGVLTWVAACGLVGLMLNGMRAQWMRRKSVGPGSSGECCTNQAAVSDCGTKASCEADG